MVPIFSLFIIITFSVMITRIATVALTHTGLSHESARFQSRSALTGTGFTTSESEKVINHPVRRRIIMLLMIVGNAGLVSAMSTLILTFVGKSSGAGVMIKIGMLVGGLAVLWFLAQSEWVDQRLSRVIDRALRRYTRLDLRDYASLMHLAGDYRIVELNVEEADWLANKTLATARLRDEGVVVLAIKRAGGTYLGAPQGDTKVVPGDVLVLYGRAAAVAEIDERRCDIHGDQQHAEAVAEHNAVQEKERETDEVEVTAESQSNAAGTG